MRVGVSCWIVIIAIIEWHYKFSCAEELKPTITPIGSHTGLYFDEIGQIFFYPTQWKIVSYVDLKPTQLLRKQVKAHQLQIVNCLKIHNATWYSLTDCRAFTPYIRLKVKYVEQLKDIVADYLTFEPKCVKRGILDLRGDIPKFLFGTLTQMPRNTLSIFRSWKMNSNPF
jgi:hypothetical protein